MDLNNLIAECTAYDFKVMLEEKKPKSWLKSVGAFANGLGGSLFFGIDNDGIVKGLADVMAQLDYMEKRGSGLKKICDETQKLKTYKEERKPVFKSTATQFMTIIYSMEYEPTDQQGEQHGTKLGLSWDQVGTKLGLSWDEVEKLFIALQEPKSMGELKDLYGWSNTTKFKAKYVSPLIEEKIVGMTLPDKPTSPKQKYFLTDSGKALLVNVTRNPNAGEEEKLNHLIGNLSEEEKRLALELLKKVQ